MQPINNWMQFGSTIYNVLKLVQQISKFVHIWSKHYLYTEIDHVWGGYYLEA